MIVAGGGIKDPGAWEPAAALSEVIDAPIVCSPGHGDAVPARVERAMGQMGPRGNPVASRLVLDADVLIVLGSRLGFNSTFYSHDNISPATKIIQVEIEPTAIGRFFDVEVGIWADAARTAADLAAACGSARSLLGELMRSAIEAARTSLCSVMPKPSTAHRSSRQRCSRRSAVYFPEDAAITMDAGTMCLQATDQLSYGGPHSLFTPLDFASSDSPSPAALA